MFLKCFACATRKIGRESRGSSDHPAKRIAGNDVLTVLTGDHDKTGQIHGLRGRRLAGRGGYDTITFLMIIASKPVFFSVSSIALVALTAACSSGPQGPTGITPEEPGNGGVVPAKLTLEPPAQGFQLSTKGTVIEPGQDTEYCEILAVPGGPDDIYYVHGSEIEMTKFSHHLIVSAVDPTLAVSDTLDVGSITHCFGAQQVAGFGGSTMVGGSQLPHAEREFPPGVGLKFTGGQKLIFDYHYYNTSPEPIHTGHRMNFETVDASEIQHIGHAAPFANVTIDIPPGERKSFVGECHFTEDVMVGMLLRHTHKWGKDFTAWFAGGSRDGEFIWTTPDYEADTEHRFADPVLMPKDTGFRFQCDYDNPTSNTLRFGEKATDEMCILFSTYWETGTTPVAPQFCVMLNIGADGVARRGDISQIKITDAGIQF